MDNTNEQSSIDYDLLQIINIIREDILDAHSGMNIGEVRLSNLIYNYMVRNFSYSMNHIIDHILAYYQIEHESVYNEIEQYMVALININRDITNNIGEDEETSSEENTIARETRDAYEHIDDMLVENGNGNIRFTRVIVNNPRYRRDRNVAGTSPSSSVSPTVSNFFENIKVILKKDELKKHRTLLFKDVDGAVKAENARCVICQYDYADDDSVRLMDCNHAFHQSCIDTWLLEYSYKCPMCRKECGNYQPKHT